ncbi:MAG TPA: hypothetical protein VM779_04885 [Thermoanaerobaculia bacterium]|nr:hypothetical protein [Thermoanaerobaculia bacterium]
MMTLDEIIAELDGMDAWKLRAMCASAAERVAPMFRRLGRAASMPTFEAGLDAVWAAVASGRPARVKGALRRLPETTADDSHSREYYANRALLILFRALDCVSAGGNDSARSCLEEVADFCDGIDTVLTSAPGQTYRYDPKNPPPRGEIETEELRARTLVHVRRGRSATSAFVMIVYS